MTTFTRQFDHSIVHTTNVVNKGRGLLQIGVVRVFQTCSILFFLPQWPPYQLISETILFYRRSKAIFQQNANQYYWQLYPTFKVTRETQLSFWLLNGDPVKKAEITAYFAVVKNYENFKFLATPLPPPPQKKSPRTRTYSRDYGEQSTPYLFRSNI